MTWMPRRLSSSVDSSMTRRLKVSRWRRISSMSSLPMMERRWPMRMLCTKALMCSSVLPRKAMAALCRSSGAEEILQVAMPSTLIFTLSLFGMFFSPIVVWKAAVDSTWKSSKMGQSSEPPPATMRKPRILIFPSVGSVHLYLRPKKMPIRVGRDLLVAAGHHLDDDDEGRRQQHDQHRHSNLPSKAERSARCPPAK